jgi:hypothetical protein
MFLAIWRVATGDSKGAAISVGKYIMLFLVFYAPWVGGNYLFPALTGAIDSAVLRACQYGIKGFSPVDLADGSAVMEVSVLSLNKTLQDPNLQGKVTAFNFFCYKNAKRAYGLAAPTAKTPKPSDSNLSSYYNKDGIGTIDGQPCSAAYATLHDSIAVQYKKTVQDTIEEYRSKKISSALAANADSLATEVQRKMDDPRFQDALFDQAVQSVSAREQPKPTDLRTPGEQMTDGYVDFVGSQLLSPMRLTLYGIMATAKWYFDRYLLDIVGTIKLFICAAFSFLFIYSLITLNPDPLIKLLGMWLFADSLYMAGCIQEMVYYAYMNNGTMTNILNMVGGALGFDTVYGHAVMASSFIYLLSFSFAGILTWSSVFSGSALVGPLSGGMMSQLKMLPIAKHIGK